MSSREVDNSRSNLALRRQPPVPCQLVKPQPQQRQALVGVEVPPPHEVRGPALAPPGNGFLFPGSKGGAKAEVTLGRQIPRLLERELGLRLSRTSSAI